MTRSVFAEALGLALLVSACQPTNQAAVEAKKPIASVPSAVTSKPLEFTKADWVQAVKATYEAKSVKTNKEGVTEFTACFKHSADGKKCEVLTFAKSDAFGHFTTFEPVNSHMAKLTSQKYLHSAIMLADCIDPLIVLQPHFFGKGGWLFLNKVAVMADGDVVLEHAFEHNRVERDSNTWGVDEAASWVARDTDIAAVKKIANAKTVIVRLSGDKGYVTVSEQDVKAMQEDFKTVLMAQTILYEATASKPVAECK